MDSWTNAPINDPLSGFPPFPLYSESGGDFLFAVPPVPTLDFDISPLGQQVHVQTFYEGPAMCKCCTNWVERMPVSVPEKHQEKYDSAAIKVYNGKDHDKDTLGGVKSITTRSIVIQSHILREKIAPILENFGRHVEEKTKITINHPFKELFFAYDRLVKLSHECEEGTEEQKHFKLLNEVMDELFREASPTVTQLHADKLITCEYLWTLFPKGILVYSRIRGQDCLLEFVDVRRVKENLLIDCNEIQFNGSAFGRMERTISQPMFHGTRKISELEVYPLSFHSDPEALEDRIHQRGRSALLYQDTTHCKYSGPAELCPDELEDDDDDDARHKSRNIVGRVIVDTYGYGKFNPYWAAEVDPLDAIGLNTISEDTRDKSRLKKHAGQRPSEESKILNANLVSIFLSVADLSPVTWNAGAYQQLICPEDWKDLAFTLVSNHERVVEVGKDMIAGKGRGLVILLSGPPGTGKTLAAEAVADTSKRPLYHIQADGIGSTTHLVSQNLRRAFDLCTEWNAILLMDEADAYLRTRTSQGGSHNNLVCVILSMMEYYGGVMMLTTNRPAEIDAAFKSRVDLHLEFPSLPEASRRKLWETFLESVASNPRISVSSSEIQELSAWELNGRQIKNIIKNCSRWCYLKQEEITFSRLMTAMRISVPSLKSKDSRDSSSTLGKRLRPE